MFFPKPQIFFYLAKEPLTLISPLRKMQNLIQGLENPSLWNLLDSIPEKPEDIIANLDTLQDARLAAWTSAPASQKTGNIRQARNPLPLYSLLQRK